MSTLVDAVRNGKVPLPWMAFSLACALLIAAVSIPNLNRSRMDAERSFALARQRGLMSEPVSGVSRVALIKAKPATYAGGADTEKLASKVEMEPEAAAGPKIIRTSSLELVVQHPAEVSDKLTELAERVGGYLVSSDGGGQNATAGTLTIRVPAARFEEARLEIRKLGLRVESEKIDAQDVTRQYVDQDANLRNLHAEEAQYLAILKQASTVKDMLVVSEKLSEVRGQIEQQQAEFNALSQQIETVALTISLRTEAEAQVFGLNWRPGYQLKLALRDGLESLANYTAAMTSILFYLPAVLLWVGTIVIVTVGGWRATRWVARRWFGWKGAETPAHAPAQVPAQG